MELTVSTNTADFGNRRDPSYYSVLCLITLILSLFLCLPAWAKTLTLLPEERDFQVYLYEEAHPGTEEGIEAFFGKELLITNREDVQNVKWLLYQAPEEIRERFLKGIGRLSLSDRPGKGTYTGGIFREVGVDFQKACEDVRGPYVTFFHECAHGIEDVNTPFSLFLSGAEWRAEYTSAMITSNFRQKTRKNNQKGTKKA